MVLVGHVLGYLIVGDLEVYIRCSSVWLCCSALTRIPGAGTINLHVTGSQIDWTFSPPRNWSQLLNSCFIQSYYAQPLPNPVILWRTGAPEGSLGIFSRNLTQLKFPVYNCRDKATFKSCTYYTTWLNFAFYNCKLYATYTGWPVLCSSFISRNHRKLL